MDSVSKQGWQVGKSLSECNQYMLDQEIACDVTFNVHPPDGSTQLIKAHRYMLIARSPVFEMMLCGDFKEATSAVIDIMDIEPQIFRDILRFVYTEEVPITADNVLPLKHVASMYMMESLTQQCTIFLEDCLSVENAAVILTQCLMFDEKDLTERTLNVISDQTKDFLESDSFLTLSQAALELFLKSDEMSIDGEEQVCQAVIKWAKHQYGKEIPDLQQTRDILGDCLKQVRFGDIVLPEWFNKCVGSSLLTDQEFRLFHLSFYADNIYHESINELKNKGFNLISRKQRPYTVNRFPRISQAKWHVHGKPDAIAFETDKAIKLNGICVYGAELKGSPIKYSLHIYIGNISTKEQTGEIISTGTPDLIQVMLDKPLTVESHCDHMVEITLHGETTFRGKSGKKRVECGGVHFAFKEANSTSPNGTTVIQGQIPGLIFIPI